MINALHGARTMSTVRKTITLTDQQVIRQHDSCHCRGRLLLDIRKVLASVTENATLVEQRARPVREVCD